jgi:hypothetical protein
MQTKHKLIASRAAFFLLSLTTPIQSTRWRYSLRKNTRLLYQTRRDGSHIKFVLPSLLQRHFLPELNTLVVSIAERGINLGMVFWMKLQTFSFILAACSVIVELIGFLYVVVFLSSFSPSACCDFELIGFFYVILFSVHSYPLLAVNL